MVAKVDCFGLSPATPTIGFSYTNKWPIFIIESLCKKPFLKKSPHSNDANFLISLTPLRA